VSRSPKPETGVDVVMPDGPPSPTPAGWRALSAILVAAAERELGSDWRPRIQSEQRG